MLQQRIIFGGLAGVEPNDIQEKAPCHDARPCPYQPSGSQNDEHRSDLIEQQNGQDPAIIRTLLGDDIDLSRRFLRGRDQGQFRALAIADEAHASECRHRARADERVDRNAAHLRKVQPIAAPQARRKGGRGRFIRKGPLHVGDEAVIVGVKAERSEGLIPAIEIGNDHRQPPERERHKENATCATSLALHAAVNFGRLPVEAGFLTRYSTVRLSRSRYFRSLEVTCSHRP